LIVGGNTFHALRPSTCTTKVEGLKARVHAVLDAAGVDDAIDWTLTAAPFMTPRGPLTDALSTAVREVTGLSPSLSTSGGTSDGRFLTAIADQIVEFGPVNQSIHKIDEHVRVSDIAPLSLVYEGTVRSLLNAR
jgi:succinyl-diaminopimelate desuccinylase